MHVHTLPPTWGTLMLLCAAAYLVGSIPFGLVVGRLAGVDLRREGSGNIGAANAFRTLGPAGGLAVLALDYAKGLLPVLLTEHLFPPPGAGAMPPCSATACVLVGVACIVGHNNSLYLGFRGGKGIATTFGVITGLSFWSALAAAVVWFITVGITRYASVASLAAMLTLPIALAWLHAPWQYIIFGTLAFVLAAVRHKGNLARLVRGEEPPMFGRGRKGREDGGNGPSRPS